MMFFMDLLSTGQALEGDAGAERQQPDAKATAGPGPEPIRPEPRWAGRALNDGGEPPLPVAKIPEFVRQVEEVVPVNVSTWVLLPGVTVGR
jgi:hypothetical protein